MGCIEEGRGGLGEVDIWARDKNKNNLTLNPEPQSEPTNSHSLPQQPVDSSLPLVHRSWSFLDKTKNETASISQLQQPLQNQPSSHEENLSATENLSLQTDVLTDRRDD